MKIGIIGAGDLGLTAAKLFAEAGHEVVISNSRGPETLTEALEGLGSGVRAATTEEAARFGEVILEAIPFGRYRELPAEALTGKIVVSASNYYAERDGDMDFNDLTQTELLAEHLRGSRVVKGFNTIYWEHLRDHGTDAKPLINRRSIPIAGDDLEAKAVVTQLIEDIGFTAFDVGTLAAGKRQETSLHGRPQRL
jgi:predicted dinucleotide-binding enzyme